MFEQMIETAIEKSLDHRMSGVKELIETEVQKALDRRTVRPDKDLTLEGYHPLPEIMGHLYSWIFVPFKGKEILVEVRYLRSTQLPNVDKLSHLLGDKKKNTELS